MKNALKKVDVMFKCKRCVSGVITRESETSLNDDIERMESFVCLGHKLDV